MYNVTLYDGFTVFLISYFKGPLINNKKNFVPLKRDVEV